MRRMSPSSTCRRSREEEIRNVADYEAIVQMLSRHCFAQDNRDVEGIAACYAKDYTVDAGSPANRGLVGREAIVKRYGERWAEDTASGKPWSRHVLSNVFVTEDRGEEVEVQSYVSLYAVEEDGIKLETTTSLREILVIEDGVWKIRHRVSRMDAGPWRAKRDGSTGPF